MHMNTSFKEKRCKLGKFLGYREKLWPIVASDSDWELRPVRR